jgi:hypothetical protein
MRNESDSVEFPPVRRSEFGGLRLAGFSPLTDGSVAICGSATIEKRQMLGRSSVGRTPLPTKLLHPVNGGVRVVDSDIP